MMNISAGCINALTIDVEGFVESNLESFSLGDRYVDQLAQDSEIETNIYFMLDLLAELNLRGTFFFLGRIAGDIPDVVKRVAEAGHEIGCHGLYHLRIYGLGRNEFAKNIIYAKKLLEDVSGQPVQGFRAPDFSIVRSTLWALDVLKQAGFIYDSSIYPISLHDVYGIKEAQKSIHKLPNDLIEFPLGTFPLLGRNIPYGGGGYLRLYPTWVTTFLVRKANMNGNPVMLYIHPYEVGPIIPSIPGLSWYRRFRHYHNCENGGRRLRKILTKASFAPAVEVLRANNFIKG